jgi:uncharacterized membrane protein (UPF0182 family)
MKVPSDMPRPPGRRGKARTKVRDSRRGRAALIVAAVALFVLITSLRGIAGFFTDYLWFDSLGQASVFRGVLGAKLALAAIFTGLFFVLLWTNLWIADRLAPKFRPSGPEEELVEKYHELVGHRAGLVRIGVSLVLALIVGVGVSSQWNEWLLFINRVDFNVDDPLFHRDVGFYVFQLPFLSFVASWLFAALVIVLIVSTVAHYLNGGVRVQTPFQRVTPQVKAHLSVLLALLALVKTGDYVLQQFTLTTSTRGTVDGALYTDVNVELPAIRLLMLISVLAFALFIANIWRRGWVLPVLAVGLWGLVTVVAGGLLPALVQKFRVEPAESSREREYIDDNIAATRQAMNIEPVEQVEFAPDGEVAQLDVNDLAANADTINDIRLWDPSPEVLRQTYRTLQEFRSFYEISDVDVDRYEIDGELTQVMVAARELDTSGVRQGSWEARHLAFTHGYGLVMSPSNVRNSEGEPVFVIGNVPVQNRTGIDLDEPAIYVGEQQGGYVIVDTKREEIDFQDEDNESRFRKYEGEDGVRIGSWLRRAAFALRFGDFNPLFSANLQASSKILFIRDVTDRLETLAPFLAFDADPYPVVVDGRVKWVVDAYATTDRYPYAQRAVTDTVPNASGLRGRSFNYVRNSVKATVDAYDGTVDLYIVDDSDPIAAAYSKAFPSLFTDDDPPDELEAHFRYPEDLFRVQTNMWGRYHQTNPDDFYNNSDTWVVARAPGTERVATGAAGGTTPTSTSTAAGQAVTSGDLNRVDPVYLLMRLPGDEEESFLIMRPFVPAPRQDREPQQLTGFMVARSDPGQYGRLQVFGMPNPLPNSGPGIIADRMSSNPDVAELQTLLGIRGGGSELLFGHLLMVPLESSLLYVRPVYVQGESEGSFPLLRKIIVEHQGDVAVGDTLREALASLFGAAIPAVIEGDVVAAGGVRPEGGTEEVPADGGEPVPTEPASAAELLAEAEQLFTEAEAALAAGDLGEYQTKIEQARDKIAEAATLLEGSASRDGTAAGSGSGDQTATTTTTQPTTGTTT